MVFINFIVEKDRKLTGLKLLQSPSTDLSYKVLKALKDATS
jgi:hypothetical protein